MTVVMTVVVVVTSDFDACDSCRFRPNKTGIWVRHFHKPGRKNADELGTGRRALKVPAARYDHTSN